MQHKPVLVNNLKSRKAQHQIHSPEFPVHDRGSVKIRPQIQPSNHQTEQWCLIAMFVHEWKS